MLNRFYSIFLLLLLPFFDGGTQITPQQHAQLRGAMDRGEYFVAEQKVIEMMNASPDAFERNNYDYLLARLQQWRGANSEAMAMFQRVIARNSPLSSYALWHQAEIERASGNLSEEQKLLQKFTSQYSDHLLRDRAIQRLSESYFETASYQEVINTLRMLSGPRRDALAMIGEAQLALGQTESARSSFEAILLNGSMDDASLRAVTGLDRISEQMSLALTEAERLRRARVYQYNRHFPEARKHWLILASDFPQSQRRTEVLFQLGRNFFLEGKFAESIKWYNQVHDEFPQTDEGEQGYYYVGHCYQYLNDADRAIARYEEFLKAYPESEYFGYAHLNAIDTMRSAGRPEEALKWAARAQALVKEPFIVVTARFNQAKIRLSQQNYAAALADFTDLKLKKLNGRGLTGTTNAPEVTYMRGYCLEKLGRFEEAINEYLSLGELRNGAAGYYGRRASERLQALTANLRTKNLIDARRDQFLAEARAAHANGNAIAAKKAANQALRFTIDEPTRDEMLKILRSAYDKLRGYQLPNLTIANVARPSPLEAGTAPATGATHQTLASELLFLGLYNEGAAELAETNPSRVTLVFYCARGNCANRTVEYSEPILNLLPDDYRLELLPRDWAEIFYPFPHRYALARHALTRGIDPRFVLSIVRQESRYDPRVKSASAARGMMQFISLTATQIAAQLKINGFEQNDLYDPDIAILFGSQYMNNLFREFDSPQAVAAAYNGSEDSVRRWRARAGSSEVDR
ncbi:MAG: transglycosylase SLT domain-containing protein, partial [Acidobacteria bacterium]|nr:transglycosylase SLT domain-containing protein [Acidobacteriota bacterium]